MRGFNLIYTLIAVVIIGVIAAIIIVALSPSVKIETERASANSNLPHGVTTFRDDNTLCYVYENGYGAWISCVK